MLLVGNAHSGNQQDTPYIVPWKRYPGNFETRLPRDYLPKLTKVGPNARKIFIMDGARYVTAEDWWDYDPNLGDTWGSGSYSASGPVYRGSVEYGPGTPGRLRSYRHGSGTKLALNALFFDGHAEYMSEKETRYHGYTTPSGSQLMNKANMTDQTQAWLDGYGLGDVLPD
jgi:prepilin-type processing-associated H-X9-DG protein